jgi:hypothetical protein
VHVRARKSLRKKDGAKFDAIHNPKVGGSIPPVATKFFRVKSRKHLKVRRLEALGLLCFIFQFIEFLFAVPNREQLPKIDRSRATAAPLLPVCAVANAIGK